jgi:DnaA family protein
MAVQLPLQFEFRANQTFADFFPGQNQDVISHLQRCVDGTGEQQIYLSGGHGLGKSHLLHASCHYAHQQNLRSFYFDLLKFEQVTTEILSGLDDCNLVCFDNMQCIAGNRDWEQAFFHFFNQHRDRGHQLIVTAPCLASELAIDLPDLKTRLNWGLSLVIKPFTDDENIAALTFKAKQLGFAISPQTGQFLLLHYVRDMPSLWALLEKLDKASLSAKRKLTIPFLKQLLLDEVVK